MNRHKRILTAVCSVIALSTVFGGDSIVSKAQELSLGADDFFELVANNESQEGEEEPHMETAEKSADETEPAELSSVQENSIAMLNYLSYLTQDINSSANSRLYMEQVYSSLINNIFPNAVDSTTQIYLNALLDTLNNYRMTAVKRERLEYIYEQNKAQAINQAVPNALGLLSAVHSFNVVDLVSSVAYMAVDSITSYNSAMYEADMQYLETGWALDDEQAETLHESRSEAFDYMLDIVRDYALPGEFALNEEAVEQFVSYKDASNIASRIQYLEANKDVYRKFGSYWITLSQSYYENQEWEACLQAISEYKKLNVHILRKDNEYASALPAVIASAEELYDGEDFVATAEPFVEDLVNNSGENDWALKYFASQVYLKFYDISHDERYLNTSYEITLNTVNALVPKQVELNNTYLAPVMKQTAAKEATKKEKAEIKSYNKLMADTRKKELAPVYEPLVLNCKLLFELADLKGIDEKESKKIDQILHENGKALFLCTPIDRLFSNTKNNDRKKDKIELVKNGKELSLPVSELTPNTQISVTVRNGENTVTYTDWTLQQVKRGVEGEIDTFTARYSCDAMKKEQLDENTIIDVVISDVEDSENSSIAVSFQTKKYKNYLIRKDIDFEAITEFETDGD